MASSPNAGMIKYAVIAPPSVLGQLLARLETAGLSLCVCEEFPARWAVIVITYMTRLYHVKSTSELIREREQVKEKNSRNRATKRPICHECVASRVAA
jgi:hypothetical protein